MQNERPSHITETYIVPAVTASSSDKVSLETKSCDESSKLRLVERLMSACEIASADRPINAPSVD